MENGNNNSAYGRARVKDNDKLEKYYKELEGFDTGALWTVANEIEPWEPNTLSAVMFWDYDKIRPYVLKAAELVTPSEAGRRVVYLINKRRKEQKSAVGLLFSGLQITQPGEFTPAHAHAASALRFIMEGKGGYTIVDGHKINLEARDFVITPNGCWHEHGVAEDGETCIWQDGLDIPLANALEANDYHTKDDKQDLLYPIDYSPLTYGGAAGMLAPDKEWDKPYSPLFKYSWKNTYATVQDVAKVNDGSPYDGVIMEYRNPVNGDAPMLTMGAAMQLLKPGFHSKAHKHTGSTMYQVAKGNGYSIIDGKRYDWKEKDIFCVPSWIWHEHANSSDTEDACLFQFNDLPTIKKLGFYKERPYEENGGYQKIIS